MSTKVMMKKRNQRKLPEQLLQTKQCPRCLEYHRGKACSKAGNKFGISPALGRL